MHTFLGPLEGISLRNSFYCSLKISVIIQFVSLYSLQATDVSNLRDLLNNVKTTNWYHLGLELGIGSDDLDIIQKHEVEDRLRLMFQKWLQVSEDHSWRMVCNALRTIGENSLAAKLTGKFCA